MAWYYHLNGTNQGPVEAPELQNLLQQQVITPDTLVWTEGMAQWTTYQTSAAMEGSTGALGTSHVCAECGKLFPEEEMLHYENSWVCATCKPLFFQRIKEGVTPHGKMIYSTVLKRFVAVFIDGIIIDIFIFIPIILVAGVSGLTHKDTSPGVTAFILFLQYGFPALYETLFIGRFGATPGKMLMKIKVVMADGGRVSYLRALGRHFAKILSALILGIGYLMAIWDEEKRALHDRICNTRVIVNDAS